jgi:hypothetical protein
MTPQVVISRLWNLPSFPSELAIHVRYNDLRGISDFLVLQPTIGRLSIHKEETIDEESLQNEVLPNLVAVSASPGRAVRLAEGGQ